MEDSSDTFIELKSFDAADDSVLPQSNDLIVTVSSPSNLTNDRSSGLVNEESIEQIRSVEMVAKKSTIEEIADMFKLIKISEPVMENTADKDDEIKTCDAANEDDVLPQNDDLIVAASSASILNDNRSSGLVNGESSVQLGSVEIIVDKSRVEEIEEMSMLPKTHVLDADDAAGKDLHLKTSDDDSNAVLSQISDPIIAASSASTLTDNESSELVKDTSYEQIGAVEIVGDKSAIEENDDKPKVIKIPESDMEDTAVSSPSAITDNRSSVLVKKTSYEQIGTLEIVADESAIEETDEKAKLIKTPGPDFEDTAGTDTEIKALDATSNVVLTQNNDLIVAVSSSSTLTDNQFSEFVKETSYEQVGTVEIVTDKLAIEETDEEPKPIKTPDMEDTAGFVKEASNEQVGTVEIVADKSMIEETDETPKLFKTPEPDMEDNVGRDMEIKTSDATSNVVLSEDNELIVAVSSPTLTDNRSSGIVDESSYEQIGTVEIVADKTAIEETDEKPKLIKTPEPDMEDTVGNDIGIKASDVVNNVNISQSNDPIVSVSSPSTLTDNQFSGLVNGTSYESIGTVEIVVDKPAIDETDGKPNLINSPESEIEDTAAKDIEILTSDVANDVVLPQNDNLIIAVSSATAGLVKETSCEQIGTVEIVKDRSAIEETNEKLKLLKTPEPDIKDTAGKFIDIQTFDAASNAVLSQNNDPIVTISFTSTLTDHESSGLVTDEETNEKPKPADEETDKKPKLAVEFDADKSAVEEADEKLKLAGKETVEKPKPADEETDEKPKQAVEIDADKSVVEETDEKPILIKTPECDMENTACKDSIIKTSNAANEEADEKPKPAVVVDAVKSLVEETDEKLKPVDQETVEKPKSTVEVDAHKLAVEETDEKPKLLKSPEPDMEDTAGVVDMDIKIKTSNAANEEVLTQNVDLVVAVSSPSKFVENRSSGLVSEKGFEQLGTVEIVADKLDIKEIEPEMPGKKPKFNLRKSLAWDQAFFTSDGVLDEDELSTMIEGGEKGVKHQLPGIQEEVYRSMDSLSSLASDNLSLECLEAELFDDIRASIQKSNRVSNPNNSNIKVSSGKKDLQPKIGNPSKKMDPDNGKRPAVRIKDNSSRMPQPKLTSRVNSTSTLSKKATLSANDAKKEQDIAKQAHVSLKGPQEVKTTLGSKVTGPIGPRRGVPKPLLSSKSSTLASSSAPKVDPTRPSSSYSNSSSCSSGTDVKTSVSLSRKKVDSKAAGKVTAGSIAKAPSRIVPKNKQTAVECRLSSRSVVSNVSSSISPASSISEWDSDSSLSNLRCSIDTGLSFRSSVESSSSIHPTDLNASQTGPLLRPPSVQPTGLRMPSPKIGFFDGGKSSVRTPTGGVRTGPTISNGSKVGKIPLPKTAAPTNMKTNLLKTTPKLAQEQQSLKSKASSASQGVKSFLVPPKQVNLGNKSVSKIDTADKSITDCSRAPFGVKN